jgi:hypothetical protein
MFIVGINLWTSDHEDYYDFEYSGIEHSTREEAEEELKYAKWETANNADVESVYIREV